MILGWLDVKDVTLFAHMIAEEYGRLRKSTALRMYDASKRKEKIEKLVQKVVEYRNSNRLNIYKKAKLIGEIRNGMSSGDVPEVEISEFIHLLVLADLPRNA